MKNSISIIKLLGVFLLTITLQTSASAQWQLPQEFGNNIDAVAYSEGQESVIFFSGFSYKYVSLVEEEEYPAYALTTINQFPESWEYVDGSTNWSSSETLLFKGHEYLVFDPSKNAITNSGVWGGLPAEWNGALDAVVRWGESRFYFFLGEEYVVYNSETQTYEEPDLLMNWEGWPAEWNNGITGATNILDGNIYFFRDGKFLAFDIAGAKFTEVFAVSE